MKICEPKGGVHEKFPTTSSKKISHMQHQNNSKAATKTTWIPSISKDFFRCLLFFNRVFITKNIPDSCETKGYQNQSDTLNSHLKSILDIFQQQPFPKYLLKKTVNCHRSAYYSILIHWGFVYRKSTFNPFYLPPSQAKPLELAKVFPNLWIRRESFYFSNVLGCT